MGCHFFLQGIFLTWGSNPHPLHLLHWQAGSLPPAPPEKPSLLLSSVQFSRSVMSDSLQPMDCSTPDSPVLHCLPEFAQTHVHESETPSNHLILCHPLLLLPSIFPSICQHPYVTSGKTLALTRQPLLASLLSSCNSIPLHPQS